MFRVILLVVLALVPLLSHTQETLFSRLVNEVWPHYPGSTLERQNNVHISQPIYQEYNMLRNSSKRNALPPYILPRNFEPMRLWIEVPDDELACTEVGQEINGITCQEKDILPANLRVFIVEYMVPIYKKLIANIISVHRVEGNLLLDRNFYNMVGSTCVFPMVNIPDDMFFGSGKENSDYYLLLIMRPDHNEYVLASAAPCQYGIYRGPMFGRPLAGIINLTPGNLRSIETKLEMEHHLRIFFHEIMHALGFTYSSYEFFHDRNGRIYGDILFESFERGHIIKYMDMPSVRDWIRWHFNCSTLPGPELEDYGGRFSHWEERIFYNEIMTPVTDEMRPVLSGLTLAFLDDTGWYLSNKSVAETLSFGFNEGCDFATKHCNHNSWKKHICQHTGRQECTLDHERIGFCDAINYSEEVIPTYYLFIPGNKTYGGSNEYADYCPRVSGSIVCEHGPINTVIGLSGQGSQCLQTSSNGNFDAECFKIVCLEDSLTIVTQAQNIDCSSGFGDLVEGYFVYCPHNATLPFCPVDYTYIIPPSENSGNIQICFNMTTIILMITIYLLF